MKAWSLKTRISLSLLVAFLLVAGIATVFAKASFRDMEERHTREDSQARVDGISAMIGTRFLTIGQSAKAAANNAGNDPVGKVLEELQRAGFATTLVLGKNETILGSSGEVQANDTLRAAMLAAAPPRDYPATVYSYNSGWIMVSSRSTDLKTSVVGAMSRSYLSDSFLVDVLIHPDYGHALVMGNGQVIASSANFDGLEGQSIETFGEQRPIDLDAHVEGRAPAHLVDERVSAMTTRFILSMAIAFGIAGSITILLIAYAFRPLDRITDAARRLGRGEERLDLHVDSHDELGELARVLDHSASALATSRRAEALRAQEARLAAEDFELAVGDLSRAVGEAETPQDVASRLGEGLLRVTSARVIVVRHANETLACVSRAREDECADALYLADPSGWHVFRPRDGEVEVAILPEGSEVSATEARKIEILASQASIALHRARAAVDLLRAKAQKETFLDILSHDLKNPLAVARGRVELLARKYPDAAPKFQQIEGSLDRAARIIEEAVLLSKLERGEALERLPVDLRPLIEESAAALQPLATPRGIEITVGSPPRAMWPANRLLQRAVENLISNAIKWSPENGRVEVRLVPDSHVCLLLVVDHGPGIPDEDKKRLFARFERADRTGVSGTGLGLAIALRVTQMHGGTIHIEDTPGGGATFVLEIPNTIPTSPPEAIL